MSLITCGAGGLAFDISIPHISRCYSDLRDLVFFFFFINHRPPPNFSPLPPPAPLPSPRPGGRMAVAAPPTRLYRDARGGADADARAGGKRGRDCPPRSGARQGAAHPRCPVSRRPR